MRVDVRKILFAGSESQREHFFAKAQEEGIVHFIDALHRKHHETPDVVHDLLQGVKIIHALPPLPQEEGDRPWRGIEIAKEVLELKNEIDRLEEQIRTTQLEIARISPFGHFSLEMFQEIERGLGVRVQYFCGKLSTSELYVGEAELIEIGQHGEMAFFVGIHRTKRQYPGLIEMFIEKTLSRLENELGDAERKLDRLQDELKPYARFDELLHEALAIAVNSQQLTIAKTGISEKLDSRVFVVEGWVSETNLKRAFEFAEELDVVAEEIKIEESDPVPTCLENEGYARIGEDLVHIYDTPSTNDKDPSLWVLCFFAIFFAIIVGDSGYGLFLLLTGGYLYYKYPNWSGGMQRFRKLLMILASVCVLWGVGSHAFFGVQFDLDSPFRKYSLFDTLAAKKAEYHLNARDDVYKDWVSQFPQIKNTTSGREAMAIGVVKKDNKVDHVIADKLSDAVAVEIALLLGVIHITISFFRNLKGSWAGIGWVFVLWGGYFYCASYLGSINMGNYLLGIPYSFGEIYGIEMINWGLIAAVVLSLIQNRLMGLLEITVVIQLFADVLSYLRLYALGLSGSILSSTVNDMAMALSFGGGIVLLLGHAINILLAIMGGVIHGLRLNFLEWYHYSFEGGGRLFKPLRLIDSDYQNKRGR